MRRVKLVTPAVLTVLTAVDALFDAYTTGVGIGATPLIEGSNGAFPVITKISSGVYEVEFAGGSKLRVIYSDQTEVVGGVPLRTLVVPSTSVALGATLEMALSPTSLVMRLSSSTTNTEQREHYAFEEPIDPSQDGVRVSRLMQYLSLNGAEAAVTSNGYINGGSVSSVGHHTRIRNEAIWQNASGTYDLRTESIVKHVFPLTLIRTDCSIHVSEEIVFWPAVLTFDDRIVIGGVTFVPIFNGAFAPRLTVMMKE